MKRLLAVTGILMPFCIAGAQESAGQIPGPAQEPATSLLQALVAGGLVMIPLAILSVITVMLILFYLVSLRRGAVVTARYMQIADALIRKRDYFGLLAVSNRHNEAVAQVMRRTLDFLTKNPNATLAEAREIAETEGVRQAGALSQQIVYLADIGAIAPMLGLLGTVIGMIKAFTVVASNMVATRPTLLAHGVAEALITTATGLVIGIPAMAAYAYFRGRTQGLVSDLESASTQLLALLNASYVPRREKGTDLSA